MIAEEAVARYGFSPDTTVELLNVSENETYLVRDADLTAVLRVHRLGYHPPGAIPSELAWLDALRTEAGVRTPRVVAATNGSRVVTVADPAGGPPRDCVLFEFLPGREPREDNLVADFEPLGALTARMHQHARTWQRPPGFVRFHWDADAAFGTPAGPGRWGAWRAAPGIGPAEEAVLARLEATLRDRLRRFGSGPDRYGLIHADLRLANLLVAEGTGVSVIDFDDCGFGWYLYDLGAALSFVEHLPEVPEVIDAWTRGYRSVAPLSAADEAELWTFVLLRRLLLVAWIGSHASVDIAVELGATYSRGSCELAEKYLSTHS
ncbi:phosphotransferase enzyme family protein [Cryptosporangium aurantiacum]|uniref:Ser/Thr protein kinase RdoA involved in Cpx stress response, MazF antagonist n=1 Tax=Cryptosporangium aurantiacum TaxID=134849 RepID=A0A1M7QDR8_9ACTN|nr:phosphotransferase [Cryptosporangium aurantiacum]SHN28810.1 Ser/Thr protein kinase RdoA involved in Cpx stress response, MazF antagonist [Cryptosporangium aurantiacum]